MRTICCGIALCLIGWAGEIKQTAQDYPAHAEWPEMDIGVDYTIHSYSDGAQMYFTKDFLVLEIAVFPKKAIDLSEGSFLLRVNNARHPIEPAAPEFVAASVRNAGWTTQPHMEASAGMGNAGVVLGAPPTIGRFPGDPNGQNYPRKPYPQPPGVPTTDDSSPAKQAPEKDAAQIAIAAALRTGHLERPAAGNIYFAYAGNAAKIKSLTLIYHSPQGDQEIRIQ